ncbi:MAG: WYL domain-containing protein [Candidatus Coatesbacteria bacterium]|nr:MAG: WYL domain-containing protein [Candidatus Coatesbacteria bacterium]
MKKSERLFYVYNLLKTGASFTIADLVEKCNVSERTIYRDIADLSAYIPLYYDDGYRLLNLTPPAVPLPLPFSTSDLLLINRCLKATPLNALPAARRKVDSVLRKTRDVMRANPEDGVDVANYAEVIGGKPPDSKNEQRTLRLLEKAIRDRRVALCSYKRDNGGPVEEETGPLGLIHYNGDWFYAARVIARNEDALINVNTIERAEIIDKEFVTVSRDLRAFFNDILKGNA